MSWNIHPDVCEMSVSDLALAALKVEHYLDQEGLQESSLEKLRERRVAYLDELVARDAIPGYSFV